MLPLSALAFFRGISVVLRTQTESCLAVVTENWVCFV